MTAMLMQFHLLYLLLLHELPKLCVGHFPQPVHTPDSCWEPCTALGWDGVGVSNLRFTGVHFDATPTCLCSAPIFCTLISYNHTLGDISTVYALQSCI